jgi:hypothetical protein
VRLQNQYRATQSDVARLTLYASQNAAFIEEVERETGDALYGFCRELLSVGGLAMGAHEVAARLTSVEQARLARMEAHYRGAVEGLTLATRSSLISEIDNRLVPGMTYGTVNHLGLAAASPDVFVRLHEDGCKRRMERTQKDDRANVDEP